MVSRVKADRHSSSSSSSALDVLSSCAEDDSVRSWFVHFPVQSGPCGEIASESASVSRTEGAVYLAGAGVGRVADKAGDGCGRIIACAMGGALIA